MFGVYANKLLRQRNKPPVPAIFRRDIPATIKGTDFEWLANRQDRRKAKPWLKYQSPATKENFLGDVALANEQPVPNPKSAASNQDEVLRSTNGLRAAAPKVTTSPAESYLLSWAVHDAVVETVPEMVE
jgi:hypothetical protein